MFDCSATLLLIALGAAVGMMLNFVHPVNHNTGLLGQDEGSGVVFKVHNDEHQ